MCNYRESVCRRSFTLVELLVSISILSLLAGLILSGMYSAQGLARESRTRSQISRLHELLMERWDSYKTRSIPVPMSNSAAMLPAYLRLYALREIQRLELPDRRSDVFENAAAYSSQLDVANGYFGLRSGRGNAFMPSVTRSYARRVQALEPGQPWATAYAAWSPEFEGAECLYMIVASIRSGGKAGIDFFHEDEIGDLDEDGMPEILDGWKQPITFLRWAPGADSNLQPPTVPDAFDPYELEHDSAWQVNSVTTPMGFPLIPLVMSGGPDEILDVANPVNWNYSAQSRAAPGTLPANRPSAAPNRPFPFAADGTTPRLGAPFDLDRDGVDNSVDNFTNHLMEVN